MYQKTDTDLSVVSKSKPVGAKPALLAEATSAALALSVPRLAA
jgi:hypothetical protein